ncbi:DUF6438 domain-containing protein [Sphingobacterium bambusae]|uniref:DUF6438 domain-containing protein n=1 Tax=Sphingobacterium bambusae TaxID=662858 RepID=A0ABW6BIQ3_9SPHI|nr:DUF6438 domain-containing protein [Sphingobacterium bambusae]WPL50094.1 DUF6438 domain-containing protein [Sphingobacterium bambusae]
MNYFYIAIATMLMLSCKSSKQPNGDSKDNITSIALQRTPCFGFCPIYEVQLHADGTASLDAQDHLQNNLKGQFKGNVAASEWQKLTTMLQTMKFRELNEEYGSRNVFDLPSVNTSIRYGKDQEKKINDYGGRGTAELSKFYEEVDRLLYSVEWKGGIDR